MRQLRIKKYHLIVIIGGALVALLNTISMAQKPTALIQIQPDFQTAHGFEATCAELDKVTSMDVSAQSSQMQQAWVICNDIKLLKQTASWANDAFKNWSSASGQQTIQDDVLLNLFLQKQLKHMLAELSSGRSVLEKLNLASNAGLVLKPQTWMVDIDGDGNISPWERRFFALPNRSNTAHSVLGMPSDSPDVQLQAIIKTDQTDVLWALSYHQFIEGLVHMLASHQYTFKPKENSGLNGFAFLSDKKAWSQAHGLIHQGLLTSEKMRLSALAETDDDFEWLPNPRQKNSAFPLLLDQGDYDTWKDLLNQFQLLWSGKTLLVPTPNLRGLLGRSANWCPAGQGLDVLKLFGDQAPSSLLNALNDPSVCSLITDQRPGSSLVNGVEARRERANAYAQMLRYLYWVN